MKIVLPHHFEPRPYQVPFMQAMDNGCKRAVLVWHRRSGKDKTVLNQMIKMMAERVGTYHYVFPEYNQGRKVLWEGKDKDGFPFMDHFPKELIQKKDDQGMLIKLKTGAVFQIIGSDRMDNIVGTNPVGIAFSEYSVQKPDVWNFYRPILAENEGWAVFDYTPRGMNHGWKLLQQAKAEPKWFSQVLTVEETGAIPPEIIEEERRQMPEALFKQEYYCDFVESAGAVFRRIEENTWHGDMNPEPGHFYQIGVDLAKYQDFTVLTPFDLNTFKVGRQDRFNQVDWNLQKSRIEAIARRYNNARIIIDQSSMGDTIVDDLVRMGLAVEGIKFTGVASNQSLFLGGSRMDLINNLSMKLEQDKIKIPNDEILKNELKSFQWTFTDSGKLRAGVPEGTHDDTVFSLALAVWNVKQPFEMEEGVRRGPMRENAQNNYGIYADQTYA